MLSPSFKYLQSYACTFTLIPALSRDKIDFSEFKDRLDYAESTQPARTTEEKYLKLNICKAEIYNKNQQPKKKQTFSWSRKANFLGST